MSSYNFVGSWEVTTYGNVGRTPIQPDCGGIRFRLDETGDVLWMIPDKLKHVPLFWCDTYEVDFPSVLRFGAYLGHVIEFRVEPSVPESEMVLRCEGWCILECHRVENEPPENDASVPFILLNALEEGYFSDVTITASNGKKFEVHSSILQLLAADLRCDPIPFSGLPEQVIGTILHYLYTECFPANVDKRTLEQVLAAVTGYPCMEKFIELCQMHVKNIALKEEITEIVNEIHGRVDQIIDRFSIRNETAPDIVSNSAELCFLLKQSIKDIVVIMAKLLVLCDTFAKGKNELTMIERNEIIRYMKSRLPVFLTQIQRLLQALKVMFNKMTVGQRRDISAYLVPEIETFLNSMAILVLEMEVKLSQVLNLLTSHDKSKNPLHCKDPFCIPLGHVIHKSELAKLTDIHHQIKKKVSISLKMKMSYTGWSPNQKVTLISRNLDYIIAELRFSASRLEELGLVIEDKIDWREFKYSFKLLTSEVSSVLQQLVTHRSLLATFIKHMCNLVQRDEFAQCFIHLGLLDPSDASSDSQSDDDDDINTSSLTHLLKAKGYLNLLESFSAPPPPSKSSLGQAALALLNSGECSDMVFEVMAGPVDSQSGPPQERTKIPAHRVIVASRCDWFKKALTSGMRESIEKKIIVHDTNPTIFKTFLEYLYTGILPYKTLTSDQLSDLLLLSDRYEMDSLKIACEYALRPHIDTDNVIYLLNMADQFSARVLRESCIAFVTMNHEMIDSDLYFELPAALQMEVLQTTNSLEPENMEERDPRCYNSAVAAGLSSLQRGLSGLHFSQPQSDIDSSLEDLTLHEDTARMEECISQLRDIIGDDVSYERLVQIVLAADYDLCRAINFFYARDGENV